MSYIKIDPNFIRECHQLIKDNGAMPDTLISGADYPAEVGLKVFNIVEALGFKVCDPGVFIHHDPYDDDTDIHVNVFFRQSLCHEAREAAHLRYLFLGAIFSDLVDDSVQVSVFDEKEGRKNLYKHRIALSLRTVCPAQF